jgi:hypothetical protein
MNSNYRDDLVELLHHEMKRYPDVARGMIFGHPGWKWQNRVFAFPFEDGVCLKLPKTDYDAALALPEAEPFCPMGERPMGTWDVITYPEAETYLAKWEWIDKALAYVKTDEGAPKQRGKRKIERGKGD